MELRSPRSLVFKPTKPKAKHKENLESDMTFKIKASLDKIVTKLEKQTRRGLKLS